MSLSAELARPLPRISRPQLPGKKCDLQIAAEAAAEHFGGVPRDIVPPVDVIAQVTAKLEQLPGNLENLSRSELRVVPYLIWSLDPKWRANTTFVRGYLHEVGTRWKSGHRVLWRHFLLNYDPQDSATVETAAWLSRNRHLTPEPLRVMSDRYEILNLAHAPAILASAVLASDELQIDLQRLGLSPDRVLTSALCVSILEAIGRSLLNKPGQSNTLDRVGAFLGGVPSNAIAQAVCNDSARIRATRQLIDGLVQWQLQKDPASANPEPVLEFLIALNGDPRFARERWEGRASPLSVAEIERWLSAKTIESFFRVINALRTNRQDMVIARREFWLAYLPYISNAWLIAGPDAVPIAQREGTRFGRFVGKSVESDHCGLMMQIRNTCIMEMNKNGRAIFWQTDNVTLPGLTQEEYNRSIYIDATQGPGVYGIAHQGDWQRKFRDRLVQMTGIAVR